MNPSSISLNTPDELNLIAGQLQDRLCPMHLERRIDAERRKEKRSASGESNKSWAARRRDAGRIAMRHVLRLTMTLNRGRENLARLQVTPNQLAIANLPEQFHGFRLLHLSDLHLDMHDTLTEALISQIQSLDYDVCVITGDFRARTFGSIERCMRELATVRAAINQDVYAILGNHDSIRMVPSIEAAGIRLLLNEAVSIERDGATLSLGGVDDPHYYGADDLDRVVAAMPEGDAKILLAHSPELFEQAAAANFDAYLCGHTHGGQICLPGGFALISNARAPRAYCSGSWKHHGLSGYTSRGSGASIVEVRFNCPPEVTLHELIPA